MCGFIVECARKFFEEFNSKACVDKFTTDQILPYLALAKGESSFTASEISKHTKTNMWVIENLLDRKFTVRRENLRFLIDIK